MSDSGRKYNEKEILPKFQESSETIRQTRDNLGDDIVRSSEKSEVNINERS
jgi:hypothetical protein